MYGDNETSKEMKHGTWSFLGYIPPQINQYATTVLTSQDLITNPNSPFYIPFESFQARSMLSYGIETIREAIANEAKENEQPFHDTFSVEFGVEGTEEEIIPESESEETEEPKMNDKSIQKTVNQEKQKDIAQSKPQQEQGIEEIISLRKSLEKLTNKYEIRRLTYCDYGYQGQRILDNSTAYAKQLNEDNEKLAKLREKREKYKEQLVKLFVEDKDNNKIENFKGLFSENEVKNQENAKVLIDLLKYHAAHYNIKEIEETLDIIFNQAKVEEKLTDSNIYSIIYAVYPLLQELGRERILEEKFGDRFTKLYKHEIEIKQDDQQSTTKNTEIYSELHGIANDGVTAYTAGFKRSKFDESISKFRMKIRLLTKEENSDLYTAPVDNIVHSLIRGMMNSTIHGDSTKDPNVFSIPQNDQTMNNRTLAISKVLLYREYFEVLCNELPSDVLVKLFNQKNSEPQTPIQLFNKLSKKDKDIPYTNNENAILVYKVLTFYSGKLTIPTSRTFYDSWFYKSVLTVINQVASFAITQFIAKPAMAAAATALTPVSSAAGGFITKFLGLEHLAHATTATAVSLFINKDAAEQARNLAKNKKAVIAGEAERHYLSFDKYEDAFILMGCSDPEYSIAFQDHEINKQFNDAIGKDDILGVKGIITQPEDFDTQYNDFVTVFLDRLSDESTTKKQKNELQAQGEEKLLAWTMKLYCNAIFLKNRTESTIKHIESSNITKKSINYLVSLFFYSNAQTLKYELAKIDKLINKISIRLANNPRFENFRNKIDADLKLLLETKSDQKIKQMAYEIYSNDNSDIKNSFDRFYKAVKSGLIPLKARGYGNVIKLQNEIAELRRDNNKASEFATDFNDKENTGICEKFQNFETYKHKIKLKIKNSKTKKDETKEIEAQFPDFIKTQVILKDAAREESTPIVAKPSYIGAMAEIASYLGIDKKWMQDTLLIAYSSIPSLTTVLTTFCTQLALSVIYKNTASALTGPNNMSTTSHVVKRIFSLFTPSKQR